jgi:hypothetical protein
VRRTHPLPHVSLERHDVTPHWSSHCAPTVVKSKGDIVPDGGGCPRQLLTLFGPEMSQIKAFSRWQAGKASLVAQPQR